MKPRQDSKFSFVLRPVAVAGRGVLAALPGIALAWSCLFAIPLRAAAPFSVTQTATQITPTNAVLNGMAVPNELASTAWFEWGTNGAFSQRSSPTAVGDGTAVVRVTNAIRGLAAKSTYQSRLVVSNSAGAAFGATHVFTTGRKAFVIGGNQSVDWWPPGVSNSVAVAAGRDHCLALKADGQLVAWGENASGQTNVPAGLNNVLAIAAGGGQSLALRANGTVENLGFRLADRGEQRDRDCLRRIPQRGPQGGRNGDGLGLE